MHASRMMRWLRPFSAADSFFYIQTFTSYAHTVSIPTPLRPLTGNLDTVEVEGADISQLISALEKAYPGIGERLLDAQAMSAAS